MGSVMPLLSILETLSVSLCGIAVILWMSIGTIARSKKAEIMGQRAIMSICIFASVILFSLHFLGGDLWGSRNAARPMAVFSLVLAAASVLNLKGKEVQGEVNPHHIRRLRAMENEE
ncbi:MAG: hypothetical protein CMB75_02040 [Euryarchaeota archaeon]|nr:hypothetical protein [Euryarchaeota archaeon]|tara:strand:+ start:8183 stop:8533 length:351 start_codon:yes stop_codon:yes gene_type:complete